MGEARPALKERRPLVEGATTDARVWGGPLDQRSLAVTTARTSLLLMFGVTPLRLRSSAPLRFLFMRVGGVRYLRYLRAKRVADGFCGFAPLRLCVELRCFHLSSKSARCPSSAGTRLLAPTPSRRTERLAASVRRTSSCATAVIVAASAVGVGRVWDRVGVVKSG